MSQTKRNANRSNVLGIDICWRFTANAIDATPEAPGVFAFFDDAGDLLLLGSATKSLQATLRSHWKGYEGPRTCGTARVAWELHSQPLKREAELALQYAKEFGRIPRRHTG
jgi:excinuclease UvrABC nuclease subunit